MNRPLALLTYAAEALGRDEFDSTLLDKLTDLPGQLGTFGRAFAGMASEIRAKQNRRAEMRAAAAIQQSILPPPWDPAGPAAGVDLHAEMHPAREIGGDFYDHFLIDPNRLAITIADVSGKYYVPQLGAFIIYAVMVLVLILRPHGLFSREGGR